MEEKPKKKGSKFSTYFMLSLKSMKLLKVVQAVKLLKFGKPFIMIFSMIVSMLAYSAIWTPAFAIGLVLILFVHEMGHVIAMNKEGFKTNAPVFIPFVGAMLFSPKGMDRRQEAVIGIGGVVLGGIVSFALLGIYYYLYPSNYILQLAYIGLFLNLFQMIPLTPLDGGRVVQAVGKNFQFIGILFLLGITILIHQPSILLIWIIVFFDFTFLSFKQRIFAASIVEFFLVFFTAFGIGIKDNATFWVCVVDSFVGFLYVISIIRSWRSDSISTENIFTESHNRHALEKKQQIFWLCAFALTVGIYISAMLITSPLIQAIK